jgi:hypothetical protein
LQAHVTYGWEWREHGTYVVLEYSISLLYSYTKVQKRSGASTATTWYLRALLALNFTQYACITRTKVQKTASACHVWLGVARARQYSISWLYSYTKVQKLTQKALPALRYEAVRRHRARLPGALVGGPGVRHVLVVRVQLVSLV